MTATTCAQCGVPIPAEAFLGQCPTCNDTKSGTQTVAVSPGGGSSYTKWIVMGAGGFVLLLAAGLFLGML